jgi:hypothetical protein
MKNRVILNSNGIPVVPKADKIAAEVAASDIRKAMLDAALSAYEQGIDTALDCMEKAYEKTINAGHESIALVDAIKLVGELRKICKEEIKKP